ncbi:peptidoglycan-binding protein [Kitasatospora griseola]|uniref:peptidoglycan-binding protein n=1 Tax=Kitasatospora griseola TaxID=2064 RepID=UPI0037F2DB1F
MQQDAGPRTTVDDLGDASTADGSLPEGAGQHKRGLSRRRRALLVVVAGAVVVSGAGMAAATLIKSPAQAAADTKPPEPDVLTAQVERRVLTSSVVVRGTVTAGQSIDVAPLGGSTGGKPVVTKLPVKVGNSVTAGQLLLETAGRPVFALRGDLPVYRDLKPGSKGQDVKQLQDALRGLGFEAGDDPVGTFGAGTKAAVTAFYAARGYDPLPALPDGEAQVEAAQDAVTGGQQALSDAQDALKAAQRATGAGSVGETGGSAAPGAGLAGATSGGGGPNAGQPVATAQKQVDRAAESLAKLKRKLTDIQSLAGPLIPANEVVFLSGFPARVDTVTGRVGSEVSGKVLTVSAGALVVKGSVNASDKGLVHPGQKVEILSELTGTKATASVASVADTTDDSSQAAGSAGGTGQLTAGSGMKNGYQLIVTPDQELDSKLAGQDVRLTVLAASSAGPVLVVPVSAVSATADGRTVVTVYSGGQRRQVEVTPGTVGGGSVQITPLVADTVGPGDQVIVGIKDAGAR